MPVAKIVILNWNGAEHLRRFLPSVVAAAPAGVEVVVADNGSTDDSLRVLATEFPSVGVLRLDANYGFAGGYNRALKQVEADYYLLLNSDIETPEGWLAPILDVLEREPDVAVVSPKLISWTDRTKFEYAGASGGFIDFLGYPFCRGRILRQVETDEGQYDDARDVFWVSGAAFCCRADVFHALGGFDADFFAHMEEIDLCWRMQLAGYRVRVVPQSRVYHLGGGTLTTDSPTKVFYNHRNNLAMLYKCSSSVQRVSVAVVRPALDLLAALSYLVQGRSDNFRAVFRAYRDFLRWHRDLSASGRPSGRIAKGRGREDLPGIGGAALSFRQEDFRADDVRQIRKIGKVRFSGGEYLCRRDEEQTSHDSRLSAADQHRRRIHPDPSGRNARPVYAGRGVVVFALPFPPHRFGLSGRAAGEFIARTRIETAARLLLYSDLTVAEIAYRVGYDASVVADQGFWTVFRHLAKRVPNR